MSQPIVLSYDDLCQLVRSYNELKRVKKALSLATANLNNLCTDLDMVLAHLYSLTQGQGIKDADIHTEFCLKCGNLAVKELENQLGCTQGSSTRPPAK